MERGNTEARAKSVREEMRPEYDFSNGGRGKYAQHFAPASNVVVLDPDVAEVFPDSRSVNDAQRALAEIARRRPRRKPRAA